MTLFSILLLATMAYAEAEYGIFMDHVGKDSAEQRNFKNDYHAGTLQERIHVDPSLAGKLHNEALDQALSSSDPKEAMYGFLNNLVPGGISREEYFSSLNDAINAAAKNPPVEYRKHVLDIT